MGEQNWKLALNQDGRFSYPHEEAAKPINISLSPIAKRKGHCALAQNHRAREIYSILPMASERRQTLSSMVVMPTNEEEVTPSPYAGPSRRGYYNDRFEQLARMEELVQSTRAQQRQVQEQVNVQLLRLLTLTPIRQEKTCPRQGCQVTAVGKSTPRGRGMREAVGRTNARELGRFEDIRGVRIGEESYSSERP
ncbi:hypothetical protein FNV43_RR08832 [Rhamnella rubrinervis]|uniref:Uncharacterized protein n=1 Tax=Rhamnella rubrinervis TaxID=2594499 RepID=A0A8K0H9B0_9ROSA|nr:hypothetical protein FNV43_RR08832 [Rhamnella rubrinervis]